MMSEMQGWTDGSKVDEIGANSEHRKNPKKVSRNIDSNVRLMWGFR